MVEHLICNQDVGGSSPLVGSRFAGIAQSVEHYLGKVKVTSSSLVASSFDERRT